MKALSKVNINCKVERDLERGKKEKVVWGLVINGGIKTFRMSAFPTVSGGFSAIVLPLLRASLFLLSVVSVSSVAMPPFALPSKRNMDTYIHCSVAWGKVQCSYNLDIFLVHLLTNWKWKNFVKKQDSIL